MIVCVLAGALLAGCGASTGTSASSGARATPAGGTPVPTRVPAGVVAVVGAAPVTAASLRHWLAIAEYAHTHLPAVPVNHRRALQSTLAFLIKAQWLLQEGHAEGIDQAAIGRLARQRSTARPPIGMTPADVTLQERLDLTSEALSQRHRKAPPIARAQAAAYYAAHHTRYRTPAVWKTLMIITRARSAALAAKRAVEHNQPWATVARRYSQDSSVLNGGAYNILESAAPLPLVHAARTAHPGQLVGPIQAQPSAQPETTAYYLFKVTGEQPGTQQPLTTVAAEIKQTLAEQAAQHALAAFERVYEWQWRERTLCAPGYIVPECRN